MYRSFWITWLIILLSAGAAVAAPALEPVVLQLKWKHQFQFAGYYAAQEQGYYRDAGLDVTIQPFAPDQDYVDIVLSGKADYGVGNSYVLLRWLNGDPLTALAAIFQRSPSVLLTKRDSGITSPQDMVGKRLLVSPSGQAIINAMLLSEGVALDSVEYVDHTLWRIDGLQTGLCDVFAAYSTNEPYLISKAGVAFNTISPRTYGVDFYEDILFATRETVEQHPERTKRFVQASLKGWAYAMAYPEELIDLILTRYPTSKSREHLAFEADAMQELLLPHVVKLGHMNPGRWEYMAQVYADLGMASFDGDVNDFVWSPEQEAEEQRENALRWALGGALATLLLALLSLVWVRTLRLQVARRTSELQASQRHFQSIFDAMPFCLALWKREEEDFVLEKVNPETARFSDNRVSQFLGTPLRIFYKDAPELIDAIHTAYDSDEIVQKRIDYITRTTGENKILSLFFVRLSGGLVMAVSDDVTEQARNERIMAARLRLMELAGECSYHDLLVATLDEAEELTNSSIGFFHFLAEDQDTLSLQAWSSRTSHHCSVTDPDRHYPVAKAGVWVDCISEGGTVIHNDYASLPHAKGAPDGHVPVVRELVAPVFRQSRIVAIVGVGNKETDYVEADSNALTLLADMAWDIAERKQAEDALRESRERYKRHFADFPIPVFAWRHREGEFYLDEYNTAASEVTHGKVRDLLGMSATELYSDSDTFMVDNIRTCFRTHDSISSEFLYRMKTTGDEQWVRGVWTFVPPETVMLHAENITDRKTAEEALQESQKLFTDMMHHTPNVVFIKDMEGRYTFINSQCEKLLGLSRESVLGKKPSEILPREVATQFETNDQWVLENRKPRMVEEIMPGPYGEKVMVSVQFPIFTPEGRMYGLGGISTDITQRKRAEKALRQSRERLEQVVAKATVPMCIVAANGDPLFLNDAFIKTFGYTLEDVDSAEKWWTTVYPDPDYRREVQETWERAAHEAQSRGEEVAPQVWTMHRKDGEARTVEFKLAALGDIAVITMLDLTDQQRVMDELTLSRDQAQAASKAKSEFLANMSHEIRTPMNGVMGMLQLLQSTPLNPEQQEYASLAIQSSRRLTRLLSDILDLSRVEAGKLTLQAEPFDLHEALKLVADLFQPIANQAGVALHRRMAPGLPRHVVGDAARLQQVLTNLVGNGFKFTSAGSVTIEAAPLPPLQPGTDRVLFSITDTGKGIPEAQLDAIFEPFVQGSAGARRDHQGAGLGLAICKRLTTLMGGTLSIESTENVGTTVHFAVSFGEALQHQPPPHAGPLVAPVAKVHTVLLAEDDPVSAIAARKQLEKLGCTVVHVQDGEDALQALGNQDFDMVFMDVQMQHMDGESATRAIRRGDAGEDNKGIPIIAMTAYAMEGDRKHFLDAGMNDYLAKPVEADQLRAVIERFSTDGRTLS